MAVLFDLDGTLLDTAPDLAYAVNQLRSEAQLAPLAYEQIKHTISEGIPAFLKLALDYDRDHPDYDAKAEQFKIFYQACLGKYCGYFPGMIELLSLLEQHHIPWGVVTNKRSRFTDPLLKIFNLSHRAACIVSGDTTPFTKPHPEPLIHASKIIGISPSECIYIGDAENDIIAGNAAGMKTITALFGYVADVSQAMDWDADHHVYHVNELWPLIQTIKTP
jgi:N-acetyl-D-muramate 6-phosphate phosphatase